MNPHIKKEIHEFLDTVLQKQTKFLTRINTLVSELDSFKSQVASKYLVTGNDSIFNKRVQTQYVIKIERLLTDFNADLYALIKDYELMMEDHRHLNAEWKDKQNDPNYKAWYAKLTQNVLEEKIGFRQKVERNCIAINKEAKALLSKLDNITEINLEEQDGFSESKKILTWCSTATTDSWMRLIMDLEDSTTTNQR